MWEIYSKARIPFMEFYTKDGYLQRPDTCSADVLVFSLIQTRCRYENIMLKCWDALPKHRPDFGELHDSLKRRYNKVPSDWVPSHADKSEENTRRCVISYGKSVIKPDEAANSTSPLLARNSCEIDELPLTPEYSTLFHNEDV